MVNEDEDFEPDFEAMSYNELKDWVRAHVDKGGALCPVCELRAQVYDWTLGSAIARVLIELYRQADVETDGFLKMVELRGPGDTYLSAAGGQAQSARHWGLIEQRLRTNNSPEQGWYRITVRGRQWVLGEIGVPRVCRTYGARVLNFKGEPSWTIRDALGKRFDFDEIMGESVGGPSPL